MKHSIDYVSLVSGVCLGVTGAVLYGLFKSRRLPAVKPQRLPAVKRPSSASTKVNYSGDSSKRCKMILLVRTDLNMGKGKIAAQCCHAALGCYEQAMRNCRHNVVTWLADGQPKVVVRLGSQDGEEKLYDLEDMAKELGIPCKVIRDAGHTQVTSGTATCAGFGPAPAALVDQITGKFKLL